MNRNDMYEKGKISKASAGTVITNVYFDAMSIEKIRFQNASYVDKTSIECYVDFEDIAILATDAASGQLIKDLKNGPKTIAIGGSKSSKRFDGAPESRIMQICLENTNKSIAVIMTAGKGKLGSTGLITADGEPDKEIYVTMPIEKFRSMIIYTYDCIRAYLSSMVPKLVEELEEDRANYLAATREIYNK